MIGAAHLGIIPGITAHSACKQQKQRVCLNSNWGVPSLVPIGVSSHPLSTGTTQNSIFAVIHSPVSHGCPSALCPSCPPFSPCTGDSRLNTTTLAGECRRLPSPTNPRPRPLLQKPRPSSNCPSWPLNPRPRQRLAHREKGEGNRITCQLRTRSEECFHLCHRS